MIVDSHHHLWDPARREYPWLAGEVLAPIRKRYDADDLRARALSVGVSRTVLVQTVPDVSETVEFLGIADDNRDLIGGVVGWVDLVAPNVLEEVARLRSVRGGDLLVGIRHQAQDEADPGWLARDEVVAGVRAVTSAGLVYDLLVFPEQLGAAVSLVEAVPEGSFVLDHAGKPPIARGEVEPWAGLVGRLAGLPNVACKLSGLVTEADWEDWSVGGIRPFADVVLAGFGAERVMFGSDWPVCELVTGYEGVFGLAGELCGGLSDDDRDAVFGGTAESWYGLG